MENNSDHQQEDTDLCRLVSKNNPWCLRCWRWIGHTLHEPVDNITQQALPGTQSGKGIEDDRETRGVAIWKQTSQKRDTIGVNWRLAQDQNT